MYGGGGGGGGGTNEKKSENSFLLNSVDSYGKHQTHLQYFIWKFMWLNFNSIDQIWDIWDEKKTENNVTGKGIFKIVFC